ncbi:MAG TPA: GMC family oxidoreductase, partial [Pyrinomonadaceae bacterium]|nr:GMC family oxidoreductase [Pyrinomonadaceae bacterium]
IPKALRTGKLTLRTNALARQVLIDADGRASGVSFIDRASKREESVRARLVVVSCASVESARLLLNSACEKFPRGLANANDLVGRYLNGHSNLWMAGYLKELIGAPAINDDGATDHSYITRADAPGGAGYKGGYGVQVQFASRMYPYQAKSVDGFGMRLKNRVRELQPALLQMGGFGKIVADRNNRVTVDPRKTDPYGIPLPVVDFNFGDNDRALFKEMVAKMEELYHAAGTELLLTHGGAIGGFASHEVGTCRMGSDPRASVLNSYCQTHEIPNLFVVDGSSFVTFPEKNPTLTIMALAVRSARYIASERKKRNL